MSNASTQFQREISTQYPARLDSTTCERILPIENAKQQLLALPIYHSSRESATGEIAVYDVDLNRKAEGTWSGACFDVQTLAVREDAVELAAFGAFVPSEEPQSPIPSVRLYRYDGSTLELTREVHWNARAGQFGTVKSGMVCDIDQDGEQELITFSIVEGKGKHNGYVELRIWNAELELKDSLSWEIEEGSISKWGSRAAIADVDGDGRPEIVTVVDYRQGSNARIEMRIFDADLETKSRNHELSRERHFSTGLRVADVDADGASEIVVIGGAFPKVRTGGTSEILVYDAQLNLKRKTEWRTFRHSWVWDLHVADVDGDGQCEIVTLGGTAMDGKGQNDAHAFSEIRVWDGSLELQDICVWQQEPGLDTRASRGCLLPSEDGQNQFYATTSRWVEKQKEHDTRLERFRYAPELLENSATHQLAQSWQSRDCKALCRWIDDQDQQLQALALDALASCDSENAPTRIAPILGTPSQTLFCRAVDVLRQVGGSDAMDVLRQCGFAVPDNWRLLSPFDNTDNKGFGREYPPEASICLDEFYAGKGQLARWAEIVDHPTDVFLDLARLYYKSFERTGVEFWWSTHNTHAVAYLLTSVVAPERIDVQLRIGNSDGLKVWLNDHLVSMHDNSGRAKVDANIIPLSLNAGPNQLLLKVANHRTSQWGIFCRITDTKGKPVPDLFYQPPKVSFEHLQTIPQSQLLELLKSSDAAIQLLAAKELAASADKRGDHHLVQLLDSGDLSVRAQTALALARLGYAEAIDPLIESAQREGACFRLDVGHTLRLQGDPRADEFELERIQDDEGKKIGKWRIEQSPRHFNLFPNLNGEDMGDLRVTLNRKFHLGDGIHARCTSIGSFGLYSNDYRGKGLGNLTMERASKRMLQECYACSTVGTGVKLVAHRLYVEHGYVDRRFPWEYTKQLSQEEAKLSPSEDVEVFPYADEFADAIVQLRTEYADNSIGPVDSPTKPQSGPWVRVICSRGKVVGYAETALDPFEPRANLSAFYLSPSADYRQVAASALPQIHRDFIHKARRELRFYDPPLALRDVLLQLGYHLNPHCEEHIWVSMFKVVDLPRLLMETTELLTRRLKKSPYSGWEGDITLLGERLRATLLIEQDTVRVQESVSESAAIRIDADDRFLTNLVSGNADIWDAYRQRQLAIRPVFNESTWRLTETLFPQLPWRHWGWW